MGDPAYEENSRLRVLGFGQLRFRSFKTNLREVIAQRVVGAVEQGTGFRIGLGQILAHAHHLRPLARIQKRRLRHADGVHAKHDARQSRFILTPDRLSLSWRLRVLAVQSVHALSRV